jgi:L-fuconolactonase
LRIDAHQHFTPQHPPEHLRSILERNRFDGSIVIGEVGGEAAHAFIKGVVKRIDLNDSALAENLDAYQSDALFRGVQVRLGDGIPAGFTELAQRGIPVDLELDPPQLPMLARIAEATPELRIAIDDLACPPYGSPMTDEWARGMEAAASLPQVFCKASNLIPRAPAPWNSAAMRPYVQHALAVFGSRRLMFGSGWPDCLPAAGWKETLAAFTQCIGAQSMETREELLGGTAARFYGLVPA